MQTFCVGVRMFVTYCKVVFDYKKKVENSSWTAKTHDTIRNT